MFSCLIVMTVFVATQSPLASSCGDFWTMVLEQNVTLVVMLVGNNEIPKVGEL